MALGYLLGAAFQNEDQNGKPRTGGTIRVCKHGTTTPYITYRDFNGNRNPADVPLNSEGMAIILADDANAYDVYCKDSLGVERWSRLNVTVGGSGGGGGGGEYVAGEGIDITGSTISVDPSVVQGKLTAGDNITINGNTISATDHDTTYSAGDGIGISSNVISRKVQFVNTSSTYSAIRHILDEGDVPVLDIANGSYHNYFFPTHKSGTHVDFIGSMGYTTYPTYEAANYMLKYSVDNNNSWTVTKYHELPDYTSTESNKFLQVNSSGNGVEWGAVTPIPAYNSTMAGDLLAVKSDGSGVEWVDNQVPAYTSSDQYKVLSVSYNGYNTQWREVREVPSYAVVNQGYLLGVVNNGGHVELGWTQPRGYFTQGVDLSGNHTLTAEDITTGYVDFETTISVSGTSAIVDPTYAALSWDVQVDNGPTSSVVSSVDFALGVSGGSYYTIFSDNNPAHETHKDWGITPAWMLNYRRDRVRARCNLASGATVGDTVYMKCGGILTQVR